jgi:hypothetical protein
LTQKNQQYLTLCTPQPPNILPKISVYTKRQSLTVFYIIFNTMLRTQRPISLFTRYFVLVCSLFFVFSNDIFAQQKPPQKIAISGTVRDTLSGETLIGVNIYQRNQPQKGTNTNGYGFFSLTIDQLPATIVYSYIGYQTKEITITQAQSVPQNVELIQNSRLLNQVTITADSYQEQVRSTQMSVSKITSKEARQLPALFGEVDILKTLQLKPGVNSGSEGTSGLYVRGGGNDQNLVLLDESIVYNASHLFGFFSTFNSDAVKEIQLYKGGFPAQYGGRLSSVVDVKMNDGNRKTTTATGGVGLITSRLTVETPIQKNKSSLIISGRRTYIDVFTRQINNANADKPDATIIPDYYFYDLNAKLNFDLTPKDKLFVSGYFGRDKFDYKDASVKFNFDWGNATGTARWNHIFGNKLFVNTSIIYSKYNYVIASGISNFKFQLGSLIRDANAKTDFYYQPNANHSIKFGAAAIRHRFDVGKIKFDSGQSDIASFEGGETLYGTEGGIYASDDWKITPKITLNSGLRLSGFVGDSAQYINPEPRFAANIAITPNVALKLSYARMVQYVHLIASSGASLPTDIWYPSTDITKPQRSDQVAAGVSIALGENFYISDEVYYKKLYNQIDLKDNAQLFANANLDREFIFGTGWGYGNEIYIEKKRGTTTGWVGYTYSQAWRQFTAINNGDKFRPIYDRRHDVSVVLMQQIRKRLSLTATWVYGSGRWATLPVGRFPVVGVPGSQPIIAPDVLARNSYQYAPYHRMDLGLVYKFKARKPNRESDLSFSLYNAYARLNPFFVYYQEVKDANGNTVNFQPKQASLFPAIPSVTYNFRF